MLHHFVMVDFPAGTILNYSALNSVLTLNPNMKINHSSQVLLLFRCLLKCHISASMLT